MSSSVFEVSDEDRLTLESWTRSSTVPSGQVERAKVVLAVAEGVGTSEAARRLGLSRPTVIKWRDRYAAHGIAGLDDEPRSGRPKRVDDATVARAWRRYGLKPWRRETFKFSTDPELEAKIRDVVGLYLNPPEKAIVLCVDELGRTEAR